MKAQLIQPAGSSVTASVKVAADFPLAMEKANLSELILLDQLATFDTVEYEVLF